MQNSFAEIPDQLWERIEPWIPTRRRCPRGGRPPVPDRVVLSGILYRLRTGCQWAAIPEEFGSRSTCYRRFVEWTEAGVFKMMHIEMLLYYDHERGIDLAWASLDSASVKAPKGGTRRDPIPQIAPNSAQNGMFWPMAEASRSRSH